MTITLAQVTAVATIVIALAVCVLTVVATTTMWRFRQTYSRVNHLLDRIATDLTPIAHNATRISENVNRVSAAIRRDVDRISATIDDANTRVEDALAMTDRRVRDFNALLAVAQDEAEQLFVSTASTVRGVRRGAEAFRERSGTDLASDELDAAIEADDLAIQEEGDGDDSNPEPAAQALPTAPRVRPRAGNRRRA